MSARFFSAVTYEQNDIISQPPFEIHMWVSSQKGRNLEASLWQQILLSILYYCWNVAG